MGEFYDTHNAGPEWGTPPYIVRPLIDALGRKFDLDPSSGAEVEPYAETRWNIEDDGLSRDWYGDVWLNPPYGRTLNPEWARYALEQVESGNVDSLTALVPAATSTTWWQENYSKADYHTFVDHRVSFDGEGDNSATFSSVICTFDCRELGLPVEYYDALRDLGTQLESPARSWGVV